MFILPIFVKIINKKRLLKLFHYQVWCKESQGMLQPNLRKLLLSDTKLGPADFDKPCQDLALFLLGKIFVRKLNTGVILKGRIVEVECYPGGDDKASFSYNNRRTPKSEPMYMPAGTTFVYIIYGVYHCFNVSSKEPGAVVLLRALEPIQGAEIMESFRSERLKISRKLKDVELCSGPSKLCMAMNINKNDCNKLNLANNEIIWIESDKNVPERIITTSRIGIEKCGPEFAAKPFRFYVHGNQHVSKRDRSAEKEVFP